MVIFITLVASSEVVGELKSNDNRDLGESTELGSFWLEAEDDGLQCAAFGIPDIPRSILWRDLGVIIDAGKTGLGSPRSM